MHTPEECAVAVEIADRLIEFYVRRDEACQRAERWSSGINFTPDRSGASVMNSDRMKRRHVRDKAVIEHLADKVYEPSPAPDAKRQSPTTTTGLPVEKQVRKKWQPKKGGLPTFYPRRSLPD